MSNIWQQVLALDARYNAYRLPANPTDRTLYIRRRSQLLREHAKRCNDPLIWKQYLRLRSQLLADRHGVLASEGSIRSRSLSMRSNSQITLEGIDFAEPFKKSPKSIVPTSIADASRALVGDTSLSENYSFAGVHHIFDQHTDGVKRIKFPHDESCRVAIASKDGSLSICEISDTPSKSVVSILLRGHHAAVTDFEWSILNDLIVSCSIDCTVRVWNPTSGECIRIVEDTSPILCCSFQPLNNNLVVTGNMKGIVQVLNISTGKYVKMGSGKMNGSALCMCCDNSGKILWVGDEKGNICSFIMDLSSGKLIKGRRIIAAAGQAVTSISSRAWVSREARDPVVLVNTTAGALCLFKLCSSDGNIQLKKRIPIRQSQYHLRSNFCPLMSFREGACVLAGAEDGVVYLFDIERDSKYCVNKLQGHGCVVTDVCFNYDESFLASGDENGTVIIWKRQKPKTT